jgi:hypothetical protein
MTNDNDEQDLRARFQSFSEHERVAMPSFEQTLAAASGKPRGAPVGRRRAHRLALIAASIVSVIGGLGLGLVWGANTGYAAARRAGDAQRDEMLAATADAKNQIAALRVTLRRMRADLTRRAEPSDIDSHLSLLSMENEIRSMEVSAQHIEENLSKKGAAIAVPPMQLTGFPVKRALAITFHSLGAAPPPVQQGIPVVDLAAPTATASETFGGILGLRQAADGSVLVNDAARRQIKLLDPSLKTSTVVVDSTPGTSASYGPFAVPLIPYLGDSSLFGERNTRTMLVLDGHGKIVRALALPKANDFLSINSGPTATDAEGRIIYRAFRSFRKEYPAPDRRGGSADSVPILRADLDFRRIDTIGKVARPVMKIVTQPSSDGRTANVFVADPLQPIDEWAVSSNGAVAFIRGHDYHIDWLQPDGSLVATPKLAFNWQRLTDEDKQRLADSVRAGQDALLSSGYPQAEYAIRFPCQRSPYPPPPGTGRGGGSGATAPSPDDPDADCIQVIQTSGIPLVGGAPARPMEPLPPLADLLRGGAIEDYLAPIAPNATLADRDGNLWVLPRMSTLSKSGELVYDVVNAQGKLFQRVRLPVGRSIAGFGKGGVVYLQSGSRASGFRLEKTQLR